MKKEKFCCLLSLLMREAWNSKRQKPKVSFGKILTNTWRTVKDEINGKKLPLITGRLNF